MSSARQMCSFFLDGLLCGLDVQQVQEVLLLKDLTPVPTAPHTVAGVINLRGQIVTAVDLRACLDFPPRPAADYHVHLIARVPGEVVSFLVDDVGDVLEIPESAFEPPPQTLRGALAALAKETCKLSGRLLLVLDAPRIVEKARTAKADSPQSPQ